MTHLHTLHPATPRPRATVIELQASPGVTGTASESYTCPSCDALLLQGVTERSILKLVFRCPCCGACSTIAPPRRQH